MTEMFKLKEGQRKAKTTLIVFFSLLASVLSLGFQGALQGAELVNALWIPAAAAMTGLGMMGGENLANAIKRK